MRTKYYFKNYDDEICYSKEYFDNHMKEENTTKIEVYEAIPEIIGGGIFWCKTYSFCGEDTSKTCGKNNCKEYTPRNNKNRVCKHHRHRLYTHGNKITLHLKEN